MKQSAKAMNEELQFHIEKFFKSYGQALNSFSASELASYYNFPCIILDDDSSRAFDDLDSLTQNMHKICEAYRKLKIISAIPKITSINILTKSIMIASIDWSYFNAEEKLLYKCEYEYILSVENHSSIHIAVAISLNEKEKLTELKDMEEIQNL